MDVRLLEVVRALHRTVDGFATSEFASLVDPDTLLAMPDLLKRLEAAGLASQVRRASGYWTVVLPDWPGAEPEAYCRWLHGYMVHRQSSYYVGLSSAARLHGVTDASPDQVYVMTHAHHAALRSGPVTLHFCQRREVNQVPTDDALAASVGLRVSSIEATLIDCATYVARIGGPARLRSIVDALHSRCDAAAIERVIASSCGTAGAQRLGYTFEALGEARLVVVLENWLRARRFEAVRLDPSVSIRDAAWSSRWRLHVNTLGAGTLAPTL